MRRKTLVAFDLDDTLIAEYLFLRSGIRHIAKWLNSKVSELKPENVVSAMDAASMRRLNHYSALEALLYREGLQSQFDMKEVVEEFRRHRPDPDIYHLAPSMLEILSDLQRRGYPLALVTDGRSITQRNKIEAAGLYRFFQNGDIFISGETGHDKLSPDSFLSIMKRYEGIREFHYVGDNPKKDFLHPSKLGWQTHLVGSFPLAVHNHG